MMFRRLAIFLALFVLCSWCGTADAGTAEFWRTYIAPTEDYIYAPLWIGAVPGQEGFHGQSQIPLSGSGTALALYRQTGPDWTGLDGFYGEDYGYPIPNGGNHTWDGIYLWAQNYAVPGHTADISFGREFPPPAGYMAHLVLDYVPDSCNWTGPTDFWIDLAQEQAYVHVVLPVAEVTDPLQGTRMHLTVYAPEPSSILALLAGLGGLGMAIRRRNS